MTSSRTRWDETWHRLRDWTNGSAPSERLAHLILLSEGYTDLDPSHPLGGPDRGKDAVCTRRGMSWVVAVYFPRGQQTFAVIKKKFLDDLRGAATHAARGIAFVTNQELSLAERGQLKAAAGEMTVEPCHLERITTILDQPHMAPVRKQFLSIDDDVTESTVSASAGDPAAPRASVWLEPTASLIGRSGAAVAPVSWRLDPSNGEDRLGLRSLALACVGKPNVFETTERDLARLLDALARASLYRPSIG